MSKLPGKNKRHYICLSALAAIGAGVAPLSSARAQGTTCDQSAIVISVISNPLDFGKVAGCVSSGGTVTISPAEARSTTGCNTSISGTVAAATIRVTGNNPPQRDIKVTIPSADSALINSGTQTMLVDNITMAPGGTSHTFQAHKSTTIDIGGRVNHGAGQSSGTYTGSFNVTAVCF